jgi:hypothetical protein
MVRYYFFQSIAAIQAHFQRITGRALFLTVMEKTGFFRTAFQAAESTR